MPGSYLKKLLVTHILREPMLSAAIASLGLPKASRGLDAGCGAGLGCTLLAEEIGMDGHVTGLDISADFLTYAAQVPAQSCLTGSIDFIQGSVDAMPFADNTFDWVWSADCVGYGPQDPTPSLKELNRVTKPGGLIAILAWSSERLLPGYPFLEARLSATTSGIAPFSGDMEPSRHFQRALGWLKALGLQNLKAEVFAGSAHAPLSHELFTALQELFDMRWSGVAAELSKTDRAAYRRLCKPESPDFILNHPDYFAFYTYSLFHGIA
jgi:demethylmenaquinone methyltransferase/2-methoxy-6-polyprenyl-1,4-benzoquinol methylase